MTRVFSMFSGVGGFEMGLLTSGKQVRLVGYSEIDKYAIQIFESKYKGIKNYGSATDIDETKLPDFDLLVGGFPCQAFSVAGKRGGFDDTRGTLFFDVARILRHKKPKHFILENVKGLLSHDSGRTFQTILKVLADIGYLVQWEVCNSKNFGVPQNRERVYLVGHLRGQSRPKVFPIRKVGSENNQNNHPKEITKDLPQAYRVYDTNGVSTTLRAVGGGVGAKTGLYQVGMIARNGKVIHKDTATCLDANYFKGFDNMGQRTGVEIRACLTPDRHNKRQNGRRFKDDGEPMFTLTSQDKHGVMITEATSKGYAVAKEGDSINLSVPNSKTRRGRVGKQIAQTLDTGVQQYTLRSSRIRRLTPTECERLQGFPDGWTEGVSDTQRYKCLGNAVTTNVVSEIAKRLLK
tara:strand:- start:1897 stop:3114 length:1218 start_codon:yes stop_codon:yes gene_type:complete